MSTLAPTAENIGTGTWRADASAGPPAARRHAAPGAAVLLLLALPLLAFVIGGMSLVWVIASHTIGRGSANLAVVGLLAGTFAVSRAAARRSLASQARLRI